MAQEGTVAGDWSPIEVLPGDTDTLQYLDGMWSECLLPALSIILPPHQSPTNLTTKVNNNNDDDVSGKDSMSYMQVDSYTEQDKEENDCLTKSNILELYTSVFDYCIREPPEVASAIISYFDGCKWRTETKTADCDREYCTITNLFSSKWPI